MGKEINKVSNFAHTREPCSQRYNSANAHGLSALDSNKAIAEPYNIFTANPLKIIMVVP